MNYEIFNPTVSHSTIADPYNDPAGLTYVSNSSLVYWEGQYWAAFDGTTQGYQEADPGQQIYMKTSADGLTWSMAFRPFRDASKCNNPLVQTVTSARLEWQPNLVIVGSELWCTWYATGVGCYVSKLTNPTAKWTNYRFEFVGTTMYLSQTVEGATTPGRSTTASFNSLSDWAAFPSQNPIVLRDGTVACPVTLFSSSVTSASGMTGAGTFTRQLKYNVLFLAGTDGSWTMSSLIDNSDFGDFCSWEPFVVESENGTVSVFSRSLNPLADSSDYLLVAQSADGGHTFSKSVSTKQYVPSSRGYALRVSPTRWLLAHCDASQLSTRLPTQSLSLVGRINGTLFSSRHGYDDFVPGVTFSRGEDSVNYPQMTVGADGCVIVNYTSGVGGASLRRSMIAAKVTQVYDDTKAYIYPRQYTRYVTTSVHAPEYRNSATPAYHHFDGYSQTVSTTMVTTGSNITYSAWVSRLSTQTAVIVDNRTTGANYGAVFSLAGLSLSGVGFTHGFALDASRPIFLAASIDIAAKTVRQYYNNGSSGSFQSTVAYYDSLNFVGQPANNDTVTINGVVYTFKTSPTLTNDVQIGASAGATATSFVAKITANAMLAAQLNVATHIVMARTNFAAFSASSQTAQVVFEAALALNGGSASIGYKNVSSSSLVGLIGGVYNARIDTTALSTSQLATLYNNLASPFGYSTISGATSPGSALVFYDGADSAQTGFTPAAATYARADAVSSSLLRLYGEGSAGVELPYGATKMTLRFKLGTLPTGTDKYVVATFGNAGQYVRLHMSGANPNALYANDRFVQTITTPTSYTDLVIIVSTNKVTIGNFELYFAGRPRMYLGTAVPENLLATTKTVDFDTAGMQATPATA